MKSEYREDYEFIHNKICPAIEGNTKEKRQLFEQFYARYEKYIKSILAKTFHIYNEEQDEVFADFLISLWSNEYKRLSNYEGDSKFTTYLYVVLRYFVLDRKSSNDEYTFHYVKAADLANEHHESDEEPSQFKVFDFLQKMRMPVNGIPLLSEKRESLYEAVQHALAQTLLQMSFYKSEDAQILIMNLCGIEQKEIAQSLGILENTLNQRLTRKSSGIRERFGVLFKEILRTHHNIDIDLIVGDLSDIYR